MPNWTVRRFRKISIHSMPEWRVRILPPFHAGMAFQDFTAQPAVLELTADPAKVFIEIAEGKFHQVKRMCQKVGKEVVYLKRVKIGALALDDSLKPGEMRELTPAEFQLLTAPGA